MNRRPVLRAACAMTALVACALAAPAPGAAQTAGDCFRQLFEGTGGEIACRFPTRLTAGERVDLKRITREMLQDATCVVDIRIERSRLDAALGAPDTVFEAPPQPMTCEITGPSQKFPIKGSFSPRVVFKAGLAVDGTPGLANVSGVPGALALPAVLYVNRSPAVRKSMLEIINAAAAEMRKRRPR